ncbi:hypothetical protein [Rhodanobacter sp. KK11]|jgi:hypothetical protein|uniref:hypothetical protein n=1 Tax=Rhodanobacter sp. KK11 TaxID=3083255 RepID=UPI0029671149|nr:hypothetical protein [Rhodanobacter sp. KK11]MDW2982421.1 hypothetical protein [Rhodanobacter sp. KK11]
MMKEHRPHGSAPTTLEADILKVRAFEMVTVLFYVEDLRQFIVHSIRFTDKLLGSIRLTNGETKTKEGKQMDLARAALVSEGIINQAESDELFDLINYRNLIGHQIHELTVDVGAYSNRTRLDPTTYEPIPAYDYTAAKRAKTLRLKVMEGMAGKFVMAVSMSSLEFEAAEKTYWAEIERLKKKINKGIERANKAITETNRAIRSVPESVRAMAQPYHARNIRENGSLTKAGRTCAFQLFDAKATPLAVAYMMRISLRSANRWFKKWQIQNG